VERVRIRSTPNREPRYAVASLVDTVDGWHWWEGEVEIENPVHGYRFVLALHGGRTLRLNATGLHAIETPDADDFRLVAFPAPPAWTPSTVMYQIFPDRFARSVDAAGRTLPDWAEPADWGNSPVHIGPSTAVQFYGGDLAGIAEHLDHLERLGVTMIYLTPIFPARSNHRYDALSFAEVDPLLGGDAALVALVEAAHARGFTVIGDLTTNHSGDAHEWFRAAHRTPGAPESEFYYWLDDQQESYVSWLGVPSLPKFNWNSRELRRRFIEGGDSVVAKWLRQPYSLDGWRIDVANMTGRYRDDDLNEEVRRIIRQTMIEVNPDTVLFAESVHDAASDFPGDAWHGAMTYASFLHPVREWLWERPLAIGEAGVPAGPEAVDSVATETPPAPAALTFSGVDLVTEHRAFAAGFPWRVRLANLNALDTHDTPRFRTYARPGTIPVALGLSVTMPGIPMIFAGAEFGLLGEDGEDSRRPIPWGQVDVAAATIDLYATLIHLRKDHEALNTGGMRWLHVGDEVLVFVRESASESVLVVAARSDFDVLLPAGAVAGHPTLLYSSAAETMTDPPEAPAAAPLGELAAGSATAPLADLAAGSATAPLAEYTEGALHLAASGPIFAAWQLPGVNSPDFSEVGTVLELDPDVA
jgi:alpha-glucosidase